MKDIKQKKNPSVFFIVPAPLGIAPGQRFRFEHYLPLLAERGIKYKVSPYFSLAGKNILYSNTNVIRKILVLLSGYFKRVTDLFVLWRYDYIYIHREAAPVGPPIFPWIIARLMKKKIVYDFDDAIWVAAMSDYNRRFSFVKSFGKVAKICKWSYTVTVGNAYLKNYAEKYNHNVLLIPTVVNTETVHSNLQQQDTGRPAIGWTGSFSTLMYLKMVLPALQKLQEEIDFTFYVIADRDPQLPLKNYRFIKWKRETEAEDLLKFHIGIMPLTEDEFSKGKCGFKAIQYMALGIPAVVSPVGVNSVIVQDGENGFICNTEEEWTCKLKKLLEDAALRKKIGRAAREKIEKQYSVKATRDMFLAVFDKKMLHHN